MFVPTLVTPLLLPYIRCNIALHYWGMPINETYIFRLFLWHNHDMSGHDNRPSNCWTTTGHVPSPSSYAACIARWRTSGTPFIRWTSVSLTSIVCTDFMRSRRRKRNSTRSPPTSTCKKTVWRYHVFIPKCILENIWNLYKPIPVIIQWLVSLICYASLRSYMY